MTIAFCLYDAFIGMSVDWGYGWNDRNPNLVLGALFWPISIPIILIIKFDYFLKFHKNKRIEKEISKVA